MLGHTLPEPRITPRAVLLLLVRVALPILAIGMALDLGVQWLFGWCVGLWCMVS